MAEDSSTMDKSICLDIREWRTLVITAVGQMLGQWGPAAAAGSFVTGVGTGWGIVTLIDAVTVNVADIVSYSMITDWPPRAAREAC